MGHMKVRRRRSGINHASTDMINHFGGNNNSYSELFKNYSFDLIGNITDLNPLEEEKDEEQDPYEVAIVYSKTEVILPNLKHFQEYSIEVFI
jgi:hypothetical protein